MTRVHIQDLGIRFGNHDVIKGLDLDVHSGEFLVLLGPSGCGKTTLLRMIGGLVKPTRGTIRVGGHDLWHGGERDDEAVRELEVCSSLALHDVAADRFVIGFLDEAGAWR